MAVYDNVTPEEIGEAAAEISLSEERLEFALDNSPILIDYMIAYMDETLSERQFERAYKAYILTGRVPDMDIGKS